MQTTRMKFRGVVTIIQEAAIATKNNVEVIRVQFPERALLVKAHAMMS